ncbi:MAG: IMPACT family protein [Candidatus Marinimicrobia bacterium]|nr:IMPACT family protein [Candidatus Neomarinimicrobiota bacterium]MDD5582285.1 IMPACT family protein [Candidatus Neomarinimicrobiota bacterium]
MKYKTLKKESHAKFTEKGSKFIGHAYPITTETEAENILKDIRKTYYNATHNCYAWRLGVGSHEHFRYSDDGEPSGTAGRPIFDTFNKHGITDILLVVTRYFGGTKLGTGGLVKAYATCAEMTLQEGEIITKEKGTLWQITCSYEDHPLILHVLRKYPIISINQTFKETVSIIIEIDEKHLTSMRKDIQNATLGRVM